MFPAINRIKGLSLPFPFLYLLCRTGKPTAWGWALQFPTMPFYFYIYIYSSTFLRLLLLLLLLFTFSSTRIDSSSSSSKNGERFRVLRYSRRQPLRHRRRDPKSLLPQGINNLLVPPSISSFSFVKFQIILTKVYTSLCIELIKFLELFLWLDLSA